MNEKFLTFLWKNRYFPSTLETTDGQIVKIISYGLPSMDSGPDFINVRLSIDGKVWAGAVEMHRKSSDWFAHSHDKDPAYQNVILHIVYHEDKPVYRPTGEKIPTVEHIPEQSLIEAYNKLTSAKDVLKCNNYLPSIPSHITIGWLDNLLIERLDKRTSEIISEYRNSSNDWEQVLFQRIARSLGTRANAEPMHILARSISYKYLKRYTDQLDVLEAILFGQAGFLNQPIDDQYYTRLQQLFDLHKRKLHLQPFDPKMWKFMRLRPYNFPTVRLAQLAGILSQTDHLFSFILEKDLSEILQLFSVKASAYWDTHFRFAKNSKFQPKELGKHALHGLIINAVVPVLFAYGRYIGEKQHTAKALSFLDSLPFENNYITRLFSKLAYPRYKATDSQALIQLYKNYCQRERCLDCRFGVHILKSTITP